MLLALKTAPAETPVSLTEAKLHLRVEHSADDSLITALIATAVAKLDGRYGRLRRALVTQTWEISYPGFPVCRTVELPMPPLQTVNSIKYFDADNVQQTFDVANYDVVNTDLFGRVKLKPGKSWVPTYERDDAVTINFTCGFGDAAACPAPIKAAILLMVGDLYVNRGDNSAPGKSDETIERLIAPYRLVTVV